jgi:hypothetical protein
MTKIKLYDFNANNNSLSHLIVLNIHYIIIYIYSPLFT